MKPYFETERGKLYLDYMTKTEYEKMKLDAIRLEEFEKQLNCPERQKIFEKTLADMDMNTEGALFKHSQSV